MVLDFYLRLDQRLENLALPGKGLDNHFVRYRLAGGGGGPLPLFHLFSKLLLSFLAKLLGVGIRIGESWMGPILVQMLGFRRGLFRFLADILLRFVPGLLELLVVCGLAKKATGPRAILVRPLYLGVLGVGTLPSTLCVKKMTLQLVRGPLLFDVLGFGGHVPDPFRDQAVLMFLESPNQANPTVLHMRTVDLHGCVVRRDVGWSTAQDDRRIEPNLLRYLSLGRNLSHEAHFLCFF